MCATIFNLDVLIAAFHFKKWVLDAKKVTLSRVCWRTDAEYLFSVVEAVVLPIYKKPKRLGLKQTDITAGRFMDSLRCTSRW